MLSITRYMRTDKRLNFPSRASVVLEVWPVESDKKRKFWCPAKEEELLSPGKFHQLFTTKAPHSPV